MARIATFLFFLFSYSFCSGVYAGLDAKVLDESIKPLVERTKGGKLGIGIKDLQSGQQWFLRGEEAFPMQSVYKLPIGIAVLQAVDAGKLKLNQEILVSRDDLSPGWSPIARAFKDGSQSFTVESLLEKAMGYSDNTAADVLLKKVGGPKTVNAMLKRAGIYGVRVDRYERVLQPSYFGIKEFSLDKVAWEKFQAEIDAISPDERKQALERFLADPRDTATPRGMIALLSKLNNGKLLSKKSRDLLFKIMHESPTGRNRIEAGVPVGSSVAHKTGTGEEVFGIGGVTNDAGIVVLPSGKKFAICVFLSNSAVPMVEREKIIAEATAAACKAIEPVQNSNSERRVEKQNEPSTK